MIETVQRRLRILTNDETHRICRKEVHVEA